MYPRFRDVDTVPGGETWFPPRQALEFWEPEHINFLHIDLAIAPSLVPVALLYQLRLTLILKKNYS